MAPAAVGTLVGTAIVVGAIALYLIIVVGILYRVSFTLGTVLIGVRSITEQAQPLGQVVGDISANVNAIEDALHGLLGTDIKRPLQLRH